MSPKGVIKQLVIEHFNILAGFRGRGTLSNIGWGGGLLNCKSFNLLDGCVYIGGELSLGLLCGTCDVTTRRMEV